VRKSSLPAVTNRDLLKRTLRHRPDRIIVARGAGGEAYDLLKALNTGHAGTLSTIHANSAAQAWRAWHPASCKRAWTCPIRRFRVRGG
jgi:pilus assembly protein CpaF